MEKWLRIASIISLQCFISMAVVTLYHFSSQSTADEKITVDLHKIVSDELKWLSSQNLSKDQETIAIRNLSAKLVSALELLSCHCKHPIIIEKMEVRNKWDRTSWVQAQIRPPGGHFSYPKS
jgi:hypothetical protein